jgi:hypothetical protein
MRINVEQFLALTVAIGAIGAVGAGVYTAQGDAPALSGQVEPMETFGDDFELELTTDASESAQANADDPPLLVNPPAPDYADEVEVASNSVAGPDVESW